MKRLHHALTVLRGIKTWQFVAIALLLTVVTFALLRHNSTEAVRLFQVVKQADKDGGDAYTPLRELQRYISQHMNTQIERITLEKTYERDYKKAIDAAAASGTVNDAKYQETEAACREQFKINGSWPGFVQCVSNGVGQTAPGQNPLQNVNTPRPDVYQFTFDPPAFSFDLAGISLLVTGVMWLIIILKALFQLVLYLIVRRHHHM